MLVLVISPFALANTGKTEKPEWAKSNYRAASGLDFIGLSQLWVPGLAQAESKSISEACTNGLGKVSEFFSVEIASSSSSSQVVVDDEFQGQFSVKTDKLSRINLTGISVSASYSELVQEGDYIQSYCLYRLTRKQVNDIKIQLEKEQTEILALVSEFGRLLNTQNLSQARITLALLRAKQNVSNELVQELSVLLDDVAKGLLSVDVLFGQNSFSSNDLLTMQLKANQNSYVYLFVDDGRYTSMVLPSPGYGFNLFKKEQIVQYPTQQQRQKGNVFKLPKTNQLVKTPEVYLVASTSRLLTAFTQTAFNRFVVNDKTGFRDFIASCRLNKNCVVTTYPLTLEKTTIRLEINDYQLVINNQDIKAFKASFKANLIEQGFTFKNEGADIKVFIKHKKVFSKKLDTDMFVAELRAHAVIQGDKRSLLKMRVSHLYDANRIDFYLESMLESASRKLLIKAENGELSL